MGGHIDSSNTINSISSQRVPTSMSTFRMEQNSSSREEDPSKLDSSDALMTAIASLSSIGEMKGETDVGPAIADSKVPRFCHECGHKYPMSFAKFCCQCGCRRVPMDH